MKITKTYRFEAAHYLPHVADDHPCGKTHGHSYRVTLTLEGECDEAMGWVRDFGSVTFYTKKTFEGLDHTLLNAIGGLGNPTAENLAIWLWGRFKGALPELSEVTVQETETSSATYGGPK